MLKEEHPMGDTNLYRAILTNPGRGVSTKIDVIRCIRTVAGLDLAQSKYIADNTPGCILEGISYEEAMRIKNAVEACGGWVEIEPDGRA